MKRIVTTLCALAVIMVGSIPAMAAEEPPRQDASYYPISVDEYTYGELEEPRINKVYQLSLSDDPSLIPTEDFERDGLWFTLLDMTRKNEVGVDTQPYTETVTRPSKTNDMAQVLQALEAEMEVTTAEGYAGTLHLDHTSVQVKTDGYATKTNRRKLTGAYSDKSPLCAVFHLTEEEQIALYATDGRCLIFSTAQLAVKTTRATQGVAVMSLKKKAVLERAARLTESGIQNPARYRTRTIPAAGALLREDDLEEKQMTLEL